MGHSIKMATEVLQATNKLVSSDTNDIATSCSLGHVKY